MPGLQTDLHPEMEGVALEDIFADEEKPAIKSVAATLETMSDLSNPWVMMTFYRRLFPFKQLFLWLNGTQVPRKQFTHREFALTLQNDVYIRYNSFSNWEALRDEIVKKNPARFEVGPVYSGKPKDRKTLLKAAFKPQMRELVFDIDMTDYDGIRTCCQDKAMCKRCWKFISMAVKVLDRTLREDLGFKHLLWVYSGRRGIHCWISDKEAMELNDDQRKALVNYIELVKGGAKMDKKVDIRRPMHPSLESAYAILAPYFVKIVLGEQNCLAKPEQWELILRLLPDKDVAASLTKQFATKPDATSAEKWSAVKSPSTTSKWSDKQTLKYTQAMEDIILQYTYPRIDTEVSKHLNHLLKSPFCIHPGTGRVCVPLDLAQIEEFEPDKVPTVGKLLMELERLSSSGVQFGANTTEWERTSLRPYVEVFQKHVDGILKDGVKDRKVEMGEEVSMEF